MPSLVVRDGKSIRYQYAGRLRENDLVYLFIAPGYSRLIDRLFASALPVADDDADFFGTFAISPGRPAKELDAAYGPGLLSPTEQAMSVAELIEARLAGKADYADRVRLGSIVLIVRTLDEHEAITGVGISLEPVEPATHLPIFISFAEILNRMRAYLAQRRQPRAAEMEESAPAPATAARENEG